MAVISARTDARSSGLVDIENLAATGLQGVVVCLLPLQLAESESRCRLLRDILEPQGCALLFRDSGGPEQLPHGESLEQLVGGTIDAVGRHAQLAPLPLGLMGAGPGAAPVLRAAVAWRARLRAVAVCGGRPQDGLAALALLGLPALVVVGGADAEALAAIDRAALRSLPGAWRLETVPGARGCFTEPGCFETAAHHAGSWFGLHLGLPLGLPPGLHRSRH